MSGHVFELHTPVLELGVRGANHALRVLSSFWDVPVVDAKELKGLIWGEGASDAAVNGLWRPCCSKGFRIAGQEK